MARVSTGQSSGSSRLSQWLLRQFCFPTPMRGIVEAMMFCLVFLAAGSVSLGNHLFDMLVPMVGVALIMMLCMVASGVYRQDIAHSIVNIYIHSAYGFFLATIAFLGIVLFTLPSYADTKFIFFFLFIGFFVINTIRPLISGTDFMDGGGRRTN